MAKLKRARSRTRPSNSRRVLIDQTCVGRKGGLAPISLPLFQGVRLLGGEQFSLSDMIVLLCYEDDEHAPGPKVVKRCRLSEGYDHRETLAANWGDPNDPLRKSAWAKVHPLHQLKLGGNEAIALVKPVHPRKSSDVSDLSDADLP